MKMYLLTQVFINNFKINFIALSVRNFESNKGNLDLLIK